MKTYYFNKDISDESTSEFIKFLNENKDEDIRFYLTSDGGETYSSQILIELINEKCKEIVGVGNLASNAFYIFFEVKISKRLMQGCYGIFHLRGNSFRIQENGKLEYESHLFELQELKKDYNKTIKWCEDIGMNEKEIKKLKKNEDVYFTQDRMIELLKTT